MYKTHSMVTTIICQVFIRLGIHFVPFELLFVSVSLLFFFHFIPELYIASPDSEQLENSRPFETVCFVECCRYAPFVFKYLVL